jgi:hypothetical protein
MLKFDDVANCKDVSEFNSFVHQYLAERGSSVKNRHSTYWALFYRWRESLKMLDER